MLNDLISIITPVYNVEEFLSRCIDSIINQTYTNWELILVNDGSTDNSSNICKNYAEKDKRIICLEQNNQGQSVARNKALDIARGKYICFVDSDDWIDPNFVKYLYEAIEKNNSELAICAYAVSDNKQNIIKYVPTDTKILSIGDFKNKLIVDKIKSFLCDKIFKKEIFNEIRFVPGVFYEDYCFYNELLPKIKKDVPVVNIPLYFYFQRENSTTNTLKLKNVIDQFNACKSRYELDYITKKEKAHCLKSLFEAYCRFVKIYDYDIIFLEKSRKYILSADKIVFSKAKKLMTPKSLTLFLLAFYCPFIYIFMYKTYKYISLLKKQTLEMYAMVFEK